MALNFSLSDEQQQWRERAQEAFAPINDKLTDLLPGERPAAGFDAVWAALAECGFLGANIPKEFGGNAGGLLASALVIEELAAAGLSNFLPILTTIDAICIAGGGSDQLKQECLPKIAAGNMKLCLAATEKESGFNVFAIRTFAEKQGDHYTVNGSKIYISGADVADALLLVCRTLTPEQCAHGNLPKTAGVSLFLVDRDSPGLQRTRVPSRGEGVMSQFELDFADVQVPAHRLIGEEHAGGKVMFQSFNPERILVAAMALGISRYCLNLACAHARGRRVFGETPIGAYQSLQHPLADVAVREDAVRWLTYRAACLFDGGAHPAEVAEAANSAKYLAAELASKAVDAAIDTFGGKGFDESYGLIHLWDSARLLKTSPISSALILNQIAEHRLQLPRSY